MQECLRDSCLTCPRGCSLCYTVYSEKYVGSSVVSLFLGVFPSTVIDTIVRVVVYSPKAGFTRRTRPHVGQEVTGLVPAITHGDSPAAVVCVTGVCWVVTPLHHRLPRLPFHGLGLTMAASPLRSTHSSILRASYYFNDLIFVDKWSSPTTPLEAWYGPPFSRGRDGRLVLARPRPGLQHGHQRPDGLNQLSYGRRGRGGQGSRHGLPGGRRRAYGRSRAGLWQGGPLGQRRGLGPPEGLSRLLGPPGRRQNRGRPGVPGRRGLGHGPPGLARKRDRGGTGGRPPDLGQGCLAGLRPPDCPGLRGRPRGRLAASPVTPRPGRRRQRHRAGGGILRQSRQRPNRSRGRPSQRPSLGPPAVGNH